MDGLFIMQVNLAACDQNEMPTRMSIKPCKHYVIYTFCRMKSKRHNEKGRRKDTLLLGINTKAQYGETEE